MYQSTHPSDDCTIDRLSADAQADDLRNEADAYERSLFLSEATADSRNAQPVADLNAEYRRHLNETLMVLWSAVQHHVPVDECRAAFKSVDTLQSAIRAM